MGSFSNCTAFESNGPKHEILGNILTEAVIINQGVTFYITV